MKMTLTEFRTKHPKIYNQILRRGFDAAYARGIKEMCGAEVPYGERKHYGLIPDERKWVATV